MLSEEECLAVPEPPNGGVSLLGSFGAAAAPPKKEKGGGIPKSA